MDLTAISLERFMCEPDGYLPEEFEIPDGFHMGSAQFEGEIGEVVWNLGNGYAVHSNANLGTEDPVATYNGQLVGFYCGEGLAVDPGHQGHGVGPALIITAAPYRDVPTFRKVTPAGDKALRRAWRIANGQETAPWPLSTRRRRFEVIGSDESGDVQKFASDDHSRANEVYEQMKADLNDVHAWQNR